MITVTTVGASSVRRSVLTMRLLMVCGLGALALAACTTDSTNGVPDMAEAFATRDSAGHTIAETTAPAWSGDAPWRLGGEPVLRIGSVEGDPASEFTQIRGVFLLADRGVAVADFGSQEVRYFDGDGRHVATAGGRGSGPGEFTRLRAVIRGRGDTLVVHDPAIDRYTVLDGRGAVVRMVEDQRLLAAIFADRWVAERRLPGRPPDALGTILRDTVALVAFEPGAAEEDTLGLHPADLTFYAEATMGGNTRRSVFPVPYAPALAVQGNGQEVVVSRGRAFELMVYRSGTAPLYVRRPGTPTPITAAHRAAFMNFQFGPGVAAGYIGDVYAEAPFPDNAGTFDRVIVPPDGPIWARHYVLPGQEERTWSIFATSGMWLGEVSTPGELEVMDVAYGRLAGVRRNELDVSFVEVYEVQGW